MDPMGKKNRIARLFGDVALTLEETSRLNML